MATHDQCIFCNLSSERIIAENELCLAIRDGFPVSEGHTLIIPKRHVADYFDLTPNEIAAMQTMMKEIKCQLANELHPDGYNIGINVNAAAGQTVFHVHIAVGTGDRDDLRAQLGRLECRTPSHVAVTGE